MTNKEVANTIWQQMNTIDRNLVWCMGTKAPRIIEQGLEFQVSGYSFKGKVQIKLNGKDLYDITFLKQKRTCYANELYGKKRFLVEYKPVKTINDVFFEDMMPFLEQEVENRK